MAQTSTTMRCVVLAWSLVVQQPGGRRPRRVGLQQQHQQPQQLTLKECVENNWKQPATWEGEG